MSRGDGVIYQAATYSAPRTRLGRWLVEPGADVPAEVRPMLLAGLFGTLVIFFGGVFNTIAVSAVASFRHPSAPFLLWAAYETILGAVRLYVLWHARRNAPLGLRTHTDAYVILALMWALGVGYGSFVGLLSRDWLIAGITTISAAAMAGGIAFRNFTAPRLCTAMVVVSFGPAAIGAAMSGRWELWILVPQVPVYLFSLWVAIRSLHRMLVRTIAAERENDRRANHDQLTGLANRAGLERAITGWQHREDRRGPLAFFYLDLDGFKAVNDRHGHAAGDALLRMVAARLQALAPTGGTAARIGGDEFVLLVPEADRGGTLGRAERVIAAIANRPYDLDNGVSVTIGTSIGIARMPDHGHDLARLMSAADAALYDAKGRGRCRAVIASAPNLRIAVNSAAPRRATAR
ncbi:GGDEF domain-containing protein [Sphingomonas sp. CGMCC 1.13654]|uniref:diguanylate cyclase n=1 Tax=Sphingomonas chungangi TaxID=2683589 RepID=A0A838L0A4_9SPHN|nr:GGDEF domain-containing protein [Sphingomonas chungangi]MVW56393.1 diguanylate cyclase [Sphingomonas chungangi]